MRGGSEIENWVFVLGGRVGAVGCLLWWTSCTTWQAGTAAAGCGTVDQEVEKEEEEEVEQACTPPLRPQRQLRSCCGNTREIPLYPFCCLWVGLIVYFKN